MSIFKNFFNGFKRGAVTTGLPLTSEVPKQPPVMLPPADSIQDSEIPKLAFKIIREQVASLSKTNPAINTAAWEIALNALEKDKRHDEIREFLEPIFGNSEDNDDAYEFEAFASGVVSQTQSTLLAHSAGADNYRFWGPPPENDFDKEHHGKTYPLDFLLKLYNHEGYPAIYFGGGINSRGGLEPVF